MNIGAYGAKKQDAQMPVAVKEDEPVQPTSEPTICDIPASDWLGVDESNEGTKHNELLMHCLDGHLDIVKKLIEEIPGDDLDPSQPSLIGATPLAIACRAGRTEVAEYLLTNEVVRRGINRGRLTPLFAAACIDNEGLAKLILAVEGIDVNAFQSLPIYACTVKDSVKVLRLLFPMKGLHLYGDWGHVIGLSSYSGSMKALKYLVEEARLDPNELPNTPNLTALHFAARGEQLRVVEYLLSHCKMDINRHDKDFFTALVSAVLVNNHKIVTRLLKEKDIDINCASPMNNATALSRALMMEHIEIATELARDPRPPPLPSSPLPANPDLNLGLDVSIITTGGSYLVLSTTIGLTYLVDYFITEKGLDPLRIETFRSIFSANALVTACATNNVDMVSFILDKVVEKTGRSQADLVNQYYGGHSPLTATALYSSVEVLDLLLEMGGDVNLATVESPSLFCAACTTSNLEFIDIIVQRPEFNTPNAISKGETALTSVCRMGSVDKLEYLLKLIKDRPDLGLDINAKNANGETPLYVCASMGFLALVKKIVEFPGVYVDLDAKSKWNDTALEAAESHRWKPVVEYLKQAKSARSNSRLPLFLAAGTVAACIGLQRVFYSYD